MSLKNTLATLGIHQHYNPTTDDECLVLTAPGQPAPSEGTELTLNDHVYVEGGIFTASVVLLLPSPGEPSVTVDVVYANNFPSVLHLAAHLADIIVANQ